MMNAPDTTSSYDIIRHIVGDKWKFLIICYLFEGPLRFGELLRLIEPIAKKVLRENLQELESLYIISRNELPGNVKNVTYALTDLGYSLQPILNELITWSLHYSKAYRRREHQK